MKQILVISQGIISIFLIIFILLQQRGQALGSIFGQGGFYGTRRGAEKRVFVATIIFGVLFVVLALLNLAL